MNEAMLLQQIRHNAESWVITKDSDKKTLILKINHHGQTGIKN